MPGENILGRHQLEACLYQRLLRHRAEQSWSFHGRERHGGQELRVIRKTCAMAGIRPGEIENKFTPGMMLAVEGQGGLKRLSLADEQMRGFPAGRRGGSVRF